MVTGEGGAPCIGNTRLTGSPPPPHPCRHASELLCTHLGTPLNFCSALLSRSEFSISAAGSEKATAPQSEDKTCPAPGKPLLLSRTSWQSWAKSAKPLIFHPCFWKV